MSSLPVLGVDITPLASYAEAVARIEALIAARRKGWAVAINPEKLYRAHADAALRELLNSADLKLCDGIGAALAVRYLHRRSIPRITGIQLFFELAAAAAKNGWRIFLLGASEASNAGAAARLCERYPGLQLAGRRNGYFHDDAAIVSAINQSRPDILFVAMGSPHQEQWIQTHRASLEAPFCMGIGGTLDVASGHAHWAPTIFRRMGLEWLYRLVSDPRRWRRQRILPHFAWLVLRAGRRFQ